MVAHVVLRLPEAGRVESFKIRTFVTNSYVISATGKLKIVKGILKMGTCYSTLPTERNGSY